MSIVATLGPDDGRGSGYCRVAWCGTGSSLKFLGVVLSAVLLHLYWLMSLPEKPPAIDWVYYKAAVAKAGMVDEFEKKLEKFRTMIPFDQMTFEDLNEVFPETKLDKEKYPYWPIEDL
ncbi:unnamed protein product [Caretta caretta]